MPYKRKNKATGRSQSGNKSPAHEDGQSVKSAPATMEAVKKNPRKRDSENMDPNADIQIHASRSDRKGKGEAKGKKRRQIGGENLTEKVANADKDSIGASNAQGGKKRKGGALEKEESLKKAKAAEVTTSVPKRSTPALSSVPTRPEEQEPEGVTPLRSRKRSSSSFSVTPAPSLSSRPNTPQPSSSPSSSLSSSSSFSAKSSRSPSSQLTPRGRVVLKAGRLSEPMPKPVLPLPPPPPSSTTIAPPAVSLLSSSSSSSISSSSSAKSKKAGRSASPVTSKDDKRDTQSEAVRGGRKRKEPLVTQKPQSEEKKKQEKKKEEKKKEEEEEEPEEAKASKKKRAVKKKKTSAEENKKKKKEPTKEDLASDAKKTAAIRELSFEEKEWMKVWIEIEQYQLKEE